MRARKTLCVCALFCIVSRENCQVRHTRDIRFIWSENSPFILTGPLFSLSTLSPWCFEPANTISTSCRRQGQHTGEGEGGLVVGLLCGGLASTREVGRGCTPVRYLTYSRPLCEAALPHTPTPASQSLGALNHPPLCSQRPSLVEGARRAFRPAMAAVRRLAAASARQP